MKASYFCFYLCYKQNKNLRLEYESYLTEGHFFKRSLLHYFRFTYFCEKQNKWWKFLRNFHAWWGFCYIFDGKVHANIRTINVCNGSVLKYSSNCSSDSVERKQKMAQKFPQNLHCIIHSFTKSFIPAAPSLPFPNFYFMYSAGKITNSLIIEPQKITFFSFAGIGTQLIHIKVLNENVRLNICSEDPYISATQRKSNIK